MPELLFEIGTEELPSWYVTQARSELAAAVAASLDRLGLDHGEVRGFATPRRVAVSVRDVAARSAVRREKRRGPPVQAAFDADGEPTRAAFGFAASNGVEVAALIREETERGAYLFRRQRGWWRARRGVAGTGVG